MIYSGNASQANKGNQIQLLYGGVNTRERRERRGATTLKYVFISSPE
jgi:hypothetical protein